MTTNSDTGVSDSRRLKDVGTGSHAPSKDYKIIVYPFDKYEIKIKLSLDGKLIEIMEVKLNKDFLSYKQRISSKDFHDVEEFYK